MPRDSNGDYSLPPGNPVVTGEVISSSWANTTFDDVATAITNSLDRNGEGGMLAGLELFAGTIGAPGLTWSLETTSGLYRAGAADFRWAIAGVDVYTVSSSGLGARAFVPTANTVPTNGMYLPSANTIGFAANTTLAVSIGTTGLTVVENATAKAFIPSSSTVPTNGLYLPAANSIGWSTNTTARGSISSAGAWTINAPSSGSTIAVSAVPATNSSAIVLDVASATSENLIQWKLNGTAKAYTGLIGTANNLITGSAQNDFGFRTQGGSFLFSADSGGSVQLKITSTDAYVGSDLIGYRGLTTRLFSGNSDTASTDAGRMVAYTGTGGHTFTGDSDLGTDQVVTVLNGGSANLTIAASGSLSWYNGSGTVSTGSRTLAVSGVCTMQHTGSGNYRIWGTGLS